VFLKQDNRLTSSFCPESMRLGWINMPLSRKLAVILKNKDVWIGPESVRSAAHRDKFKDIRGMTDLTSRLDLGEIVGDEQNSIAPQLPLICSLAWACRRHVLLTGCFRPHPLSAVT
jgi:hypothetical protein